MSSKASSAAPCLSWRAPPAAGVAFPGLEHVAADDPDDALPERVRVPEPQQRAARERCADLVVAVLGKAGLRVVVQAPVAAPPCGVRLAEVVEQRGEPHRQREARVCGGLDDGKRVLVDGEIVVAALLVEADGGAELRQKLD